MSKVFVSFLGNSPYHKVPYKYGDSEIETRFVQEALIENLCKEWTKDDRICIFLTSEAKNKNWLGKNFEKDEIDKRGLKEILDKKISSGEIRAQINAIEGLPDSQNEEADLWEIFNIVYSSLKDNDEIYFDVTHAFRFIPLFATILFNYSEFIMNTTLKKVMYGVLQKKSDTNEESGTILDLSNIIRLQKLTEAASGFVKYGKISEATNIFRGMKVDQHVRSFCSTAAKLEQRLSINDMDWIRDGSNYISDNDEKFHRINDDALNNPIDQPSLKLLDRLYHEMVCDGDVNGYFMKENTPTNVLRAIKWELNYDMLPQAVTMLQEYIKEFLVNKFSEIKTSIPEIDGVNKDKDENRKEFVSKLLNISDQDIQNKKFLDLLKTYQPLAEELLNDQMVRAFRPKFQSLTEYTKFNQSCAPFA